MKKNNNSLLLTIMGGAIFCFVFLGMAFIFTNNTKIMKGNGGYTNQSQINNGEINLGDTTIAHCTEDGLQEETSSYNCTCGEWVAGENATNCATAGGNGSTECLLAHNVNASTCYQVKRCTPVVTYTCTKCESGYKPSSDGSKCEVDLSSVTAPCCVTNSSGSKTTYEELTACQQAYANGATVTSGRCPVSEACDEGFYDTGNGNCQKCGKGTWSAAGSYSCANCPPGYTSPEGSTSVEECTKCPAGTYSSGNGGECLSCRVGTSNGSEGASSCTECSEGYYADTTGLTSCKKCPSGQSSEKGATSCETACCVTNSTGSKTTIIGENNCQYAASQGAQITDGGCEFAEGCTVSVSTASTGVSVDSDGNPNSYYTVVVNIEGTSCAGKTVIYHATNGILSTSSYTVPSDSASTRSVSFTVKPQKACSASSAWAVLDGNSSNKVTVSSVYNDWKPYDSCKTNPEYTSFESADRDNATKYYSDYGTCPNGSTGYTVEWRRWMCGTSPTPPACYTDDDNNYYWTNAPQSSWKKVPGVTKKEDCKAEEDEACYLDPTGEYQWGKFAKYTGYTLITSIKDAVSCKKPTPEEACYSNGDDYLWGSSAPEGYTIVEGVTNPEDCAPEELPACYIRESDGKWFWGKYGKTKGYIILEDIESEEDCHVPDIDACYVDKNGKYFWGKYDGVEGYTLVASITEKSKCTPDVPVPPTGISVSKLIYIFMAILMACGVGFIYYSSVVKKNS